MLIVSQDGKQSINLDNITRIFIEDFSEDGDGFGIGADTNSAESQCWDLGYYNTEKRAKEVLEEIIDIYAGKIFINNSTEQKPILDDLVYRVPMDSSIQFVNTNIVYRMPKE